jgi:hypothetical protein
MKKPEAPKKAPKNFSNLLSGMVAQPEGTSPAAEPTPEAPKSKYTSFALDGDLKVLLDRVVFWRGPSSSQREVINDVLRAFLENEPTAQQPVPGEKK